MPFVTCPKQGREMQAVVLRRVGFLAYSCPKQGQDFKPLAAPLHPNVGQVPPPPGPLTFLVKTLQDNIRLWFDRKIDESARNKMQKVK